jgi:hypothetical protein
MKQEKVIITAIKRINDNNEVLPTIYTVTTEDQGDIPSMDFTYALQCFVSRL